MSTKSTILSILLLLCIQQCQSYEDNYLRFVKDGCFLKGEAFACVKYKALKIAKKTIFGNMRDNETIIANAVFSFVPLDEDTINNFTLKEDSEILQNESRGFLSEWTEIAKYFVSLVREFFKMRGLRVNLPEGARTIEDPEVDDDGKL